MLALYPGSFDPPHFGHLDLITRAAALVDRLIVGVAVHPDKVPLLADDRRVALLAAVCAGLGNVRIVTYRGATVTFARGEGVGVLVRGLRNHADFEAEQAMATVNRGHGLDTLFVMTDPAHAHLSSRLVRQVLAAGLPLEKLVPTAVAAALR